MKLMGLVSFSRRSRLVSLSLLFALHVLTIRANTVHTIKVLRRRNIVNKLLSDVGYRMLSYRNEERNNQSKYRTYDIMVFLFIIIIVRCREISTTIFSFWDDCVKSYNRILIKVLLVRLYPQNGT